ncbi:MAG: ATP-binding cassette domain-containing protein [Coriobacteriales bacterium]|nr:ATP-binding cassette domain-containing protein [Coriobacteriales bacterium]
MAPETNEYAIRLTGLVFEYPDKTRALDGVDLCVGPGERVALLGPNGAGKSTLILHMNGVYSPTAGSVAIDGIELADATVREVRSRVGLVFQDPDDQLFMTTVYDDVAFGPLNMGLSRDEVDERVHSALHAVGLADVASKPSQHLSFGQRKRIALATVLSMRPSVLVLDEPTSNLDPRAKRTMTDLLAGLDATALIATHDMDLAWRLTDRAIVLDGGRIVADGPTRELLADEELLVEHGLELPAAVRYADPAAIQSRS